MLLQQSAAVHQCGTRGLPYSILPAVRWAMGSMSAAGVECQQVWALFPCYC